MIPELHTDRLTMRGHVAEDLDASYSMWSLPAVVKYISGEPNTKEQCWARLLRMHGHWGLRGFGYWLVEETATGRFVGEVGFADFLREITPSISGTMEAGWVLHPDHHGKGYASEAARAALDWAAEHWPELPVTCLIAPAHATSKRVAQKLGFVERCTGTYHGEPTLVLDLPEIKR